jgi:hypothetical protein
MTNGHHGHGGHGHGGHEHGGDRPPEAPKHDHDHDHDHDHGVARINVEDLPLKLERRLLHFINSARIPEDLLRPPQRVRITLPEHHQLHGHMDIARAGEENPLDADHHDVGMHPRPERIDFKAQWQRFKLDRDQAADILRNRPPLGFMRIRDLVEWKRDIIRPWLEILIRFFSNRQFGNWSTAVPVQVNGVTYPIQNAALLKSGKVLLVPSGTDTVLWDPVANTFEMLPGAQTGLTADLFCSGHSFLSNGKLLVCGGGGGGPGQPSSIQAWKFDPDNETWARTATDMAVRRWYPTVVTLGDEPGRALVVSGWTGGNPSTAPRMEIYSETTDSFTLVATSGPAGEKTGPQTYPGLHMLPGGELFYVPVGFGDCSQSPQPHAASDESGYFVFDSPATGTSTSGAWTNTGPNIRTKGMSALLLQPTYPFARVLVVGGGTAPQSATAQVINLSTLSPTWGPTFPLLYARVHPNVVLLPDGTVFICGGMEETGTPPTGGPCELWDPTTNTLTEMDELGYPRHYHSVAILLPSGQVMAAGGASAGGCSLSVFNTIELYDPPYLFKGARPTMGALPALVHHGQSFVIQSPEADSIARVVLVRPMAVTHQTDTEQRVVQLQFHQSGAQELTATMPNGVHPHGIAPRGHYMLFILNADKVPSVGQFVFLH